MADERFVYVFSFAESEVQCILAAIRAMRRSARHHSASRSNAVKLLLIFESQIRDRREEGSVRVSLAEAEVCHLQQMLRSFDLSRAVAIERRLFGRNGLR